MQARTTSKLAPWLVCAALAAVSPATALAQSSTGAQGLLDNPWVIDAGAFIFGWQLDGNLNGRSGNNPDFDFDEAFGTGDDSTRMRVDVLWRFTPVHHLRLMVFDNAVSRSKVLEEDLHWGDYVFESGARVDFEHRLRVYALAYEYDLVRRPDLEVAASAGLHYLDTVIRLSGAASAVGPDGNRVSSGSISHSRKLPAPLPMIGLRAGWVVAPDWYLYAHGQLFKARIDGYDGSWSDLRAGATWMFHRNFGVGLGYSRFAARLSVGRDDYDGGLRLGYAGLQAYLTATF
jgi:hypothetical protein